MRAADSASNEVPVCTRLEKSVRDDKLIDGARFLRSWVQRPLTTGAISPSGKALARTMARYVNVATAGPVVEIGPGTGPVTEALIAHGIAEERLILIEFSAEFCALLRERFPKATIIEGDAYAIKETLEGRLAGPLAATLSSLPLVTKPESQRLALVRQAFQLGSEGAPFIQFTYGTASPVPLRRSEFSAEVSGRIWRNIPPARVWVYRKLAS
jgi:phosphatidylethanolamine/phosphatidyl-N-methylethanolamine N-methyltransferase